MDAKITKKRIAQMLSYDWVKIVAVIVGAILFWSLIFQMTATRITPAQQFHIYNYYCNESLGDGFYNVYEDVAKKNKLSYEVMEMNVTDLTRSDGQHFTLLDGAVETDDGDLIFIPNVGDANYKTETDDGAVSYEYTYVETFSRRYFSHLYNLDLNDENSYFKNLERYLNGFYTNGYMDKESLNEEKVKSEFKKRIERTEDKRFKKDAEIERAATWEVERIKKYRDALEEFYGYYESGVVSFTSVSFDAGNGMTIGGVFGLNICPDVSKTGELKKQVSYLDENQTSTAKDMNVLFFDFDATEDSFEYESLLFVNQVIAKAVQDTANKAANPQ